MKKLLSILFLLGASLSFGQSSPTVAARIHDSLTVTGTFLDTITGMTTVPTATVKWAKVGPRATVQIPAQTGNSNTTACTIKTLPAVIRPTTAQEVMVTGVEDNSIIYSVGTAQIGTNGIITLTFAADATTAVTATFTNTGIKGWTRTLTFTYLTAP